MYIPNPYFKNIPQIGNLVLDYVFVEDGYPILFTCVTEERIFLCLCRTLAPEQKWILAEIKFRDLERLIKNELCIRDVFKSYTNGKSCIVKWSKDYLSETYEVIPTAYLNDDELPSEDVFLEDANSDVDAVVYLEQVRNRIQNNLEKSVQVESEVDGYIVTEAVSFVGVGLSREDCFELTYKMRKCKINTIASVNFSINDEMVNEKTANNDIAQVASDHIAPAA